MPTINMRSAANSVKGQGVGSCYLEQVKLVKEGLPDDFTVYVNSRKSCDIMHYHTVNLGYFIERVIRGHKSVNIGYVHFLPDTLDDSLRLNWLFRKVFYRYLLFFYNSMDYLVTVNPCVIEKMQAYNINKPKLICIPNFVSQDNFYPIEGKTTELRAEFDLPQDKFIVLGAGQLQTRKGIVDFVETAKKLPHIQFIWAGGFSFGKMSDGYDKIKAITENPPNNVKFIGIIDREKMNHIYNACDMLFLPSFDELFPMTILEAIACKKPILLRAIEVYKDILFDCYLKGTDPDSFAMVIKTIAVDRKIYGFWQEKSWECSQKYNEASALKMWESFYTAVYQKAQGEQPILTEGTL